MLETHRDTGEQSSRHSNLDLAREEPDPTCYPCSSFTSSACALLGPGPLTLSLPSTDEKSGVHASVGLLRALQLEYGGTVGTH